MLTITQEGKRKIRELTTSYECGLQEIKKKENKYKMDYVILALYFILYDIEYLLLLPLIKERTIKGIIVLISLYFTTLFEIYFLIV